MTTPTVAPIRTAIPVPVMGRAGRTTVGLLFLLSLGAIAGGVALVSKPDGSVMKFSTTLLAGSPFSDFFFPGLILGGLFGVGSAVVAIIGLRSWRIAPFAAFAIGCGMMIWIVVELAIIKELSFLHPAFFGVGLAIAATSLAWGWSTLQGWRASRT